MRTITLHPFSLLAGSVIALLAFVAMGQKPTEATGQSEYARFTRIVTPVPSEGTTHYTFLLELPSETIHARETIGGESESYGTFMKELTGEESQHPTKDVNVLNWLGLSGWEVLDVDEMLREYPRPRVDDNVRTFHLRRLVL